MQRINPMNHPIQQHLGEFAEAESDYQDKFQEKSTVDQEVQTRQRELQRAEQDAISAMQVSRQIEVCALFLQMSVHYITEF